MRKHILAETIENTITWLTKGAVQIPVWYRTLTIIVILAFAFIGYYFLGVLGAIVGIIAAVGMMDELGDKLIGKETITQKVFCPQCGLQQEWAENKQCERCWSPLRK